ncbi:MAG: hypothetical protein IPK06_02215 [Ignavibacteriae bacterium]|nr:hypothetical protein [Ignavibacteriota bacterium]
MSDPHFSSNFNFCPASLNQPIILRDLTTNAKSGTSFVTTEPVPTNANLPIECPQTIVELAPMTLLL